MVLHERAPPSAFAHQKLSNALIVTTLHYLTNEWPVQQNHFFLIGRNGVWFQLYYLKNISNSMQKAEEL
jgi:hypothetical protein